MLGDASLIVTIVSIYLAAVWSTGSPNLQNALVSRWRLVIDGSKSRFRMHESRRESTQAWATIVTKVSELYFAFVCCMRLCFPDRFVKPLYQDLQTWCCLAFLAGLRWTCRPQGHMSKYGSRCVTVLFNVSSLLAARDLPQELLPASAVSRAAHGLFTEDPLFTVCVRVACLPLAVFIHWLREDEADKLLGCVLVVVNEVISCFCMALTLLEVDAALCKQEQATIELEKQIEKREMDMKETEQVLAAARRLLSVTCDCCERLTHEWQIIDPSKRTLELLQHHEETKLLPFLQFIAPEDRPRVAHFASDSHRGDAPSSLHLHMQTTSGNLFEAQIFLVNLPGSVSQNESQYLIGIATMEAQEASNMVSIPEHQPLQDLDLAKTSRKRAKSLSAASSSSMVPSSSASVQQDLLLAMESIDRVSLLVDLQTGAQGYCIRSAQFLFKEAASLDALPKLYSWVRQRHQPTVEDWIQEHVNQWYATGSCTTRETCRGIKCRVAGTQMNFLVGELSTPGIAWKGLGEPEEDYSPIMKIDLRQLLPV